MHSSEIQTKIVLNVFYMMIYISIICVERIVIEKPYQMHMSCLNATSVELESIIVNIYTYIYIYPLSLPLFPKIAYFATVA